MICSLLEAVTAETVVNFLSSIFGVALGAALAIFGQHRLNLGQRAQRVEEERAKIDQTRYAALVEAQVALFRQAETIMQLKGDLLDHEDFQAGRESYGLLPAYESVVSAPAIELGKVAFLAQGNKGDHVDAELLHDILLAQASYENTRLAIVRHNKHEAYIRSEYPSEMVDGLVRFPMSPDSFDAHIARDLVDKLYELSPLTTLVSKTGFEK
ncbi:hypothetical protein SH580_05430 [Coraliomargarita algicola]|uniref:Uncharacterized protein n=1 Tax=Coraliomargarita algicola TaxID=3092156 RepID=A0ABZ0RPW4_9BACT|nr:hypothetical protein [Coraliomargarita sp. J2-16]WPJ97148.1 hypothetical protein SH580_05430 [Coraliomargarita sp. J2-16]